MSASLVGRLAPLAALLIVAVVAVILVGPIAQPQAYHDFADQRAWRAIPNLGDVLSNLPFLVVGMVGLWRLRRRSRERGSHFVDDGPIAFALFSGILLTAFGSAFYHWAPSDHTLVWDRLPMAITFMAVVAGVLQDRLSERLGRRSLLPLQLLGLASVVTWAGTGDLRLYFLVQFYPLFAIPMLWWRFPPRTTGTRYLVRALISYGVAKLLELGDGRVFEATGGAVSGHTLKHLAAGWASLELLNWWQRRRRH